MTNFEGHLPESTRFAQAMKVHVENNPVTRNDQPVAEIEQTMEERAEARRHAERTLGSTAILGNELEGENDG